MRSNLVVSVGATFLLLAVGTLAGASAAQARTHYDDPTVDAKIAHLHIGSPPVTVHVQHDVATGCHVDEDPTQVSFVPRACIQTAGGKPLAWFHHNPDRLAVVHETGHLFDSRMSDAVRWRFAQLMHYDTWATNPGAADMSGWWWQAEQPQGNVAAELFADAYANCAIWRGWYWVDGEWMPNRRQYRQVCAMIHRESIRLGFTAR